MCESEGTHVMCLLLLPEFSHYDDAARCRCDVHTHRRTPYYIVKPRHTLLRAQANWHAQPIGLSAAANTT